MEQPAEQAVAGSSFDFSTLFVFAVTILGFLVPMILVYPPVPPRESDLLFESHTKLGLGVESSSRSKGKGALPSGAASRAGKQLATIQSLWIYPLKSCRGIRVARSKVLATGLEFDRFFTFAQLKGAFPVGLGTANEEKDQHSWHFITQRQFPLLATLEVELWQPDVAKAKRAGPKVTGAFLVFRFPWRDQGVAGALSWLAAKLARGLRAQPEKEVLLPVDLPSERDMREKGYTLDEVTIWRDKVMALNMEADLPPELRLYLGVSNKLGLFRLTPEKPGGRGLREVHRCAPTQQEAGYQPVTGFQDAYPVHLINDSSVRDLDAKVVKDAGLRELDAQRFRANIVVTGPPAYDEDEWKAVRFKSTSSSILEDCTFHVSCRTVRCKLPNVDPSSGARHAVEPDRTLRSQRAVDEGAPGKGCFGMQLTPLFARTDRPESMEVVLEVGMAVDVLERGPHRYVPI